MDTPANSRDPIRSVLDILVCAAGEMMRDGRMKLVGGVPGFSDEVNRESHEGIRYLPSC